MINYSIHTLELNAHIGYEHFCAINESLDTMNVSIETRKKEFDGKGNKIYSYIYRRLPCYGVNRITLSMLKMDNNIIGGLIHVNINPYNALHKCSKPGAIVIEPERIRIAMNLVRKDLIKILGFKITSMFTLNRLDFCADLRFAEQVEAEEYIKLLKRGVPSKVLTEAEYFNPIQHRYTPYRESLLLECGSYSFQIYSKYQQMKNHKMKNFGDAAGIVRLELRASKPKLEQLAKKYKVVSPKKDYLEFLEHAPDITEREIPQIVSKMVGKANFHTYQYVKEKIQDSGYKDSYKQQMLDVIRYFSKYSSGQKLLETFCLEQRDWNKLVKRFDELNCSPISVSRTYRRHTYPGVSVWDAVF